MTAVKRSTADPEPGQLPLFPRTVRTPHLFHDQTGNWADAFGEALRGSTLFNKRPRVLGLFSGAGGLDIGFHDSGFEIVETVEYEEQFVETIKLNSSPGGYLSQEQSNICIDIKDYNPSIKDIDFIIGGPPCQSFSAAGARASGVAGTKDERGTLFQEYVRLLSLLQPRGFLFENVYRIVGANGGRAWRDITQAFLHAGYHIVSRILDSADYGVAQHRERLIIVGIRKDLCSQVTFRFPRPTHGPDALTGLAHISAGAALAGLPVSLANRGLSGRYGHLLDEIPPGLNYSFFTERMGHPRPIFGWRSKFSDFLYKADPSRPVRTLKASGGQYTGPFHWDSRPFTIDELKRLQSFPDRYEITGSKVNQIKQIGNSVPPQFARIMALAVAEQIFAAKTPLQIDYLMENEVLSFTKRKSELTAHYEAVSRRAISSLNDSENKIDFIEYSASLSDDFSWSVDVMDGDNYSIFEHAIGTELSIELKKSGIVSKSRAWSFRLSPKESWLLPFTGIHVSVNDDAIKSYTACWKAVEHFIIRNSIKADLVQLFNYYQYDSAVHIETLSLPCCNEGRFVEKLARGQFLNRLLTLNEIARECDITEATALYVLLNLKTAGFEVRSKKTNAAIEDGFYLVPYAFPTLTRLSVQRTKELI